MSEQLNRDELAYFGNLELLAKQVVEGFITGFHKSPFHGFSVEFAEHRLYNTGESTRHMDWKLYARTGKLFTKKYEEETNLRCQLVIDCSSSMLFPENSLRNKLRFAVYATASLIELLRRQRDAVGISLFTEELDLHTETKSSDRHIRYLYHELEKQLKTYESSQKHSSSTAEAIHTIAELCHRRSLVVIFSDLLDDPDKNDELFRSLQHLRHNGHEVILFHVVHKKFELDFDLENRPYQFIDMETGERFKLQPSALADEYKERTKKYFREVELRCGRYGIDFMTVDCDESYHEILLKYLLKRQKMF